jgi:hypothetical protein
VRIGKAGKKGRQAAKKVANCRDRIFDPAQKKYEDLRSVAITFSTPFTKHQTPFTRAGLSLITDH